MSDSLETLELQMAHCIEVQEGLALQMSANNEIQEGLVLQVAASNDISREQNASLKANTKMMNIVYDKLNRRVTDVKRVDM